MNELVKKLKDATKEFADKARAGMIDNSNADEYFNKIILAAAEVYKNEDIVMYQPLMGGGSPAFYMEGNKIFIPLYTQAKSEECKEFKETNMKEVFDMVNDNQECYEMVKDQKLAIDKGYNYEDVVSYTESVPKMSGVMLDAESDDLFGFEDWLVKAVIFKGIGVDTFRTIDGGSGETVLKV